MRRLKALLLDPEFERRREFLQRVPLFRGLRRRQFGALFRALATRNYHRGETLFSEGDIGRALFLIESGRVELTRGGQRLAVLEAGDYFGEMALLEERPRTATATAVDETRACLLYKTELEQLLTSAPEIGAAIMAHLAQILSARLRAVMDVPRPPEPAKKRESVTPSPSPSA